uniref:BUB1 N-terminal domain-containing protein n=1 Tax=Denticeps clupeoides TaxID=299321 RepID=A0AAY4BBA2_9TELE
MFSHLHAQGIGVKRAALYCAWAEALEKLGDLHKANAVYLDGLRSGATPQDELQTIATYNFTYKVTGTVPLRVKCLALGHNGSKWDLNLGLQAHRRVCYPLGYYHPSRDCSHALSSSTSQKSLY